MRPFPLDVSSISPEQLIAAHHLFAYKSSSFLNPIGLQETWSLGIEDFWSPMQIHFENSVTFTFFCWKCVCSVGNDIKHFCLDLQLTKLNFHNSIAEFVWEIISVIPLFSRKRCRILNFSLLFFFREIFFLFSITSVLFLNSNHFLHRIQDTFLRNCSVAYSPAQTHKNPYKRHFHENAPHFFWFFARINEVFRTSLQ